MIWTLLQHSYVRPDYPRSHMALVRRGLAKRNGQLTDEGRELRQEYDDLAHFFRDLSSMRRMVGLKRKWPEWM